MIEYRIEDDFETTVERYWETFFSDAYNAALWEALQIDRVQLELRRVGSGDDEVIHRRQRLTPRRTMPPVLQRLVGEAISYEEVNEWHRKTSSMSVVTIPSFLADQFEARGQYRVHPRGAGRVLRTWEARCACRVPLVGGKIERHVVDEVRESYRKTTAFTRRWLAEHPA
jgi:hypothetical protein